MVTGEIYFLFDEVEFRLYNKIKYSDHPAFLPEARCAAESQGIFTRITDHP